MNNKRLFNFFLSKMKDIGYTKKGSYIVKVFDEQSIVNGINIQKSAYGEMYYINFVCTYSNTVPKLGQYDLTFRINELAEDWNQEFIDYLNFENDLSEKDREDRLDLWYKELILPTLESLSSKNGIIEFSNKNIIFPGHFYLIKEKLL